MATSADYQPPQPGYEGPAERDACPALADRPVVCTDGRSVGLLCDDRHDHHGLTAPRISVIWPSLAVQPVPWRVYGCSLSNCAGVDVSLYYRQGCCGAGATRLHDFGMPRTTDRSTPASLEEIAAIAGPDDEVSGSRQGGSPLTGIRSTIPTQASERRDAQRANASYTDSLRELPPLFGPSQPQRGLSCS